MTGSVSDRNMPVPGRKSWIFYALLAVLALPVALFDIFPSQDGAAHLGNGAIYVDLGESILDTYFDIEWFPFVPNVLVDVVLGTLLLFTSPFVAERIFVLVMLVGLPTGVRWCLVQLERDDSVWPSLLAVPLGASLLLYFGFYSFLLGVTLSLVALGYWLRATRSDGIRPMDIAVLAGLTMLVFTSHPLPFLALMVLLSVTSLDIWLAQRAHNAKAATEKARRHALAILVAATVPMALLAIYALDQQGTGVEYGRSLFIRVLALPLDALVSFSNWEIPFALLVSAGIVFAAASGIWFYRRSALRSPGFLVAALIFTAAYFVSPNELGPGGVVLPRLVLFAMIAAILWLGTLTLPSWIPTTVAVIATVATIGLTLARIPEQTERHGQMAEFATGIPVIEAESTVLPLWGTANHDPGDSRIEFPRKTWSGYLAGTKQSVDLSHFPAYVPAFPIEFRPQYDIRRLSDLGEEAFVLGRPLVDASGYASRSRGDIDYVWIWDRGPNDLASLDTGADSDLAAWLEANYELIFVSSPRGLLEIYERSE